MKRKLEEEKKSPRRRIKLKIRRKATNNENPQKPQPPRKLVLKIKANGVEKESLTTFSGEEEEEDESESSEDFEPVPPWTIKQTGGKTIRYAEELPGQRSNFESVEELEERSLTGRRKRKKRNIEGKLRLEAYDWILEICRIVGNQQKKKRVMEIIKTGLQGGFVSGMANAAQKDAFLATLSDPKGEIRSAGIFHIEHCGKSLSYTCLSIFATEPKYQKQGLGRLLTAFVIAKSLENKLQIVVPAREEAVPFWTHNTLGFREMTAEELRKYNRASGKKKKKSKDDLIDLIYDGPQEDLIAMSLLRFRPSEPETSSRGRSRRTST